MTDDQKPEDSAEGSAPAVDTEASRKDIDAILSDPSKFTLSDGTAVTLERLKTRGMLRLLRIFTASASDAIASTKFSLDMDPEAFTGIFLGAMLMSVPEQEDETVDFIRQMVRPRHYIQDPRTPQEHEANQTALQHLMVLLDDPEPEDTMAILSALITVEAPNILSLGKQFRLLLDVQRKALSAKRGKNSPSEQ